MKHGEFRRSRGRYYANPPEDATADDEAPAPIIRKSTVEMLAEIETSRPPSPPPTPQPAPPEHEHRRICPAPEPEEPPLFQHALFTWSKLREELAEIEHLLPGVIDWAKDVSVELASQGHLTTKGRPYVANAVRKMLMRARS